MVADSRSPGLTSSPGGAASNGLISNKPADAEPLQLTLQAAAQIRGLIIDRVLLPGEKIRQVELADRLGVSRSPLREALRTLESEGVVAYEINRGYVVARLDDDDLAQIYRMRALLEDELLRTVKRPDAAVLSDLWSRSMSATSPRCCGTTGNSTSPSLIFHRLTSSVGKYAGSGRCRRVTALHGGGASPRRESASTPSTRRSSAPCGSSTWTGSWRSAPSTAPAASIGRSPESEAAPRADSRARPTTRGVPDPRRVGVGSQNLTT